MKNNHRNSGTFELTHAHPDIYKLSVDMQTELFKRGISWHNTFADECCPDFSCCAHKEIPKSKVLPPPACESDTIDYSYPISSEQAALNEHYERLKIEHADLQEKYEKLKEAFNRLLKETVPDKFKDIWRERAGLSQEDKK